MPYTYLIHVFYSPYTCFIHNLYAPYKCHRHTLYSPYTRRRHTLYSSYMRLIHALYTGLLHALLRALQCALQWHLIRALWSVSVRALYSRCTCLLLALHAPYTCLRHTYLIHGRYTRLNTRLLRALYAPSTHLGRPCSGIGKCPLVAWYTRRYKRLNTRLVRALYTPRQAL